MNEKDSLNTPTEEEQAEAMLKFPLTEADKRTVGEVTFDDPFFTHNQTWFASNLSGSDNFVGPHPNVDKDWLNARIPVIAEQTVYAGGKEGTSLTLTVAGQE